VTALNAPQWAGVRRYMHGWMAEKPPFGSIAWPDDD
jgi:hypothetical protein